MQVEPDNKPATTPPKEGGNDQSRSSNKEKAAGINQLPFFIQKIVMLSLLLQDQGYIYIIRLFEDTRNLCHNSLEIIR